MKQMHAKRSTILLVLAAAQAVACSGGNGAESESDDQSFSRGTGLDFAKPYDELDSAQRARFEEGVDEFSSQETVEDGIGPVFNDISCVNCHVDGGTGGGSKRLETRFGRLDSSGRFDALSSLGGSLMQDHAIGTVKNANGSTCMTYRAETPPSSANVVALRRTTPLFGLGLVDATPSSVFEAIARAQPSSIRGRLNMVTDADTGATIMGKFGWKSQVGTLHSFAGDAYLNEMGITSPSFPNEACPQGDCGKLRCNPVADINDDGDDVDLFADFMTFLAAPPRARWSRDSSSDVSAGERVFDDIGCAGCHVATLTSGSSPVRGVSNKTYHPYSDFLLHDMGRSGDGIGGQGTAAPREMRTAPLWGLRAIKTFWHDGRAFSVQDAILAHDGQGTAARERYRNLDRRARAQLLAFLSTL